jgi:hypothetical protein
VIFRCVHVATHRPDLNYPVGDTRHFDSEQPSEDTMNTICKRDPGAGEFSVQTVGSRPEAGEQASVQHDHTRSASCRIVPSSSLYPRLLRISVQFAFKFADLPITARFICISEVIYLQSFAKELHI